MKKFLTIIILCISLQIVSVPASAQQDGLGVGAMLNTPTGISLKTWINDDFAMDGAISFSISDDASSFYIHSNILYYGWGINDNFNLEKGELRAYYGAGFRLEYLELIDDTILSIRGPVGVNYEIEDTKAETFFELVPTIDFNPDFRFLFGGAIGFRYYLN